MQVEPSVLLAVEGIATVVRGKIGARVALDAHGAVEHRDPTCFCNPPSVWRTDNCAREWTSSGAGRRLLLRSGLCKARHMT